jgi:hypothetical protein
MLARQLLLERASIPLTTALEKVGGLQTQYAPSAYVALWSRLRDFKRSDLTEALEQRRAIQATLMRSTIHIVSATDYQVFAAGVRRARREWWLSAWQRPLTGLELESAAAVLRRHLATGPRRATELKALLAAGGFPPVAWEGVRQWVDLVRVPPSGTWEQRRADLFGLAEDWVGGSSAGEEEGLELLARRYLAGFGPASLKDMVSWAGVPAARLQPVLDRLRLRRFRDEKGGELLDLPNAPLPDADTPAPVRFLSTWEALLLIHARRTLVLPEHYRPLIFHTKNPQSVPTFLVDGQVAGTWRYQDGSVKLSPFEPLPTATRRELEAEAARLAEFHGPGAPRR